MVRSQVQTICPHAHNHVIESQDVSTPGRYQSDKTGVYFFGESRPMTRLPNVNSIRVVHARLDARSDH